jgi:glyoxylase-like metal-dependent hydrolase (beta-lactamase superfamily II)
VLSIPDPHAVFCGDLLWKNHVPNLIDATTKLWGDTLRSLIRDYPKFVYIPGHGTVADSTDITTFVDYLAALRMSVQNEQSRGESANSLVNTLLPRLKEKYGTWGFFDDFAKENILQTAQELAGHKRVPQPTKPDDTR